MKDFTMENKQNSGAVNCTSQAPTLQIMQLQDSEYIHNNKALIYENLSQYDLCECYLSDFSRDQFTNGAILEVDGLGLFTFQSNKGNNGEYFISDNETGEKYEPIAFISSVWKCSEYETIDRISKESGIVLPSVPFEPDKFVSSSIISDNNYLNHPYFSFYNAPISNTTPFRDVSLPEIAEIIRSDMYKSLINRCRSVGKSASAMIKKTMLDYVTISGSFKHRKEDGLSKYSGLIFIDFDNLENPETTKHQLSQDNNVPPFLIFISPSGKGLKVVYKVGNDPKDHSAYFYALLKYLSEKHQLNADPSGKDISRACFLSHDPDLYFNKDYLNIAPLGADFISEYSNEIEHITSSDSTPIVCKDVSDEDKEQILSIASRIIERSADGQKHYELCKASYLLGGFVGGGIISEDVARNALRDAIENKPNVMRISAAFKTIGACIQAGKEKPLYNYSKWKDKYDEMENSFFDDLLSVSFPLSAFPEEIVRIVKELHVTDFYPIEYTAASILFVSSVAFGSSLKVKVKSEWEEYANLFITLVGPSGIGKSSPMSFIIRPLEIEDNELYKLSKSKSNDDDLIDSSGHHSASQHHSSQLLVNDFTMESLFQVLKNNPYGVGLYKDELIGWINEMTRYRNGSDLETWNSIFSCKSIRVDRKGEDQRLVIPSPKVSVIGSTQLRGAKLLTSDENEENGFAHRILFVFPDKFKINEFNDAAFSKNSLQYYNDMVHKLLDLRKTDHTNKLLELNAQALHLFKNFYNSNQKRKADTSLPDSIRGMYSKMDSYVIRISLTLQPIFLLKKE